MLRCILLLLIFVSCFLAVHLFKIKTQLNQYKNKSKSFFQTKEIQFKNFISKYNFIKTKEVFLSKQGYPLKLDVIRYYFFKITIAVLFFIAGMLNGYSIFYVGFLAFCGYFIIDLYLTLNRKSRDAEICNDILAVIQSICLQLVAQIPLKDSLKKQYENCKNKDFKKAMISFSTCYELSELNIDLAIQNLNSQFDILELNLFCNALREYHKSGSIIEVLENLAENLQEKQLESLKADTRNKVVYITCGVIVALTNIVLLTLYPLFISVGEGFQNIFK